MSFITRLLNIFPLSKSVFVSTRNDLDAKFRMADDTDRDKLITDDLIDIGHIIYHEADGKHYKLKTYPTYGSLTGVVWEETINNAQDLSDHITDDNNPHSVTKTQVGLSNVDNTSDINKPVSADQQDALDLKTNQSDFEDAFGLDTDAWRGALDLDNVDNTSDNQKEVSQPQQAA